MKKCMRNLAIKVKKVNIESKVKVAENVSIEKSSFVKTYSRKVY